MSSFMDQPSKFHSIWIDEFIHVEWKLMSFQGLERNFGPAFMKVPLQYILYQLKAFPTDSPYHNRNALYMPIQDNKKKVSITNLN